MDNDEPRPMPSTDDEALVALAFVPASVGIMSIYYQYREVLSVENSYLATLEALLAEMFRQRPVIVQRQIDALLPPDI